MDKTILAGTSNEVSLTLQQQSLINCVAMEGPAIVALVRATDLKVLFGNKQFEHYLGYSNQFLSGHDLFFNSLFDEFLYERLMFQLNIVQDDVAAQSRYVIYPLKHRNGEVAMFYLYASPVFMHGVIEMYYLVMHHDMSKWDMPFTSFNTRELFLEQFNSEDFGTFEWLIESDKVFWSQGIYHIYEIDDRAFEINKFFTERFIHPDDKDKVRKELDEALQTGVDANIEYKIITAKNNTKIIHSLARVIKNKEGKLLKFAGSIRDVTEQRQIEQDLRNKVAQLNHSNKELEEFAYVASHDMQEPLRKITTYSDRLSEKYKDALTGDGLLYLSRMIIAAENMRVLINDLLEFSRISKTAQPFELVDLNIILKQAKTDLELIVEETGTVIDSDVLPIVHAIPSQMKQLFTNIIGNAIKFHKEGISPIIRIRASSPTENVKKQFELLKNNTYHQVEIADNGIGFEEEYKLRIFQVFQRLHGKSDYPGSGIGLAICKKILEYHHGIIYAEGVPGEGASFIFILPQ